MRRLTQGFTLAEVLITLGIIGVVASISLPGLTLNILKQQTGPALAKAVNSLETASHLAIEEGQVRTLDQLAPNNRGQLFNTILAPYLSSRNVTRTKPYYNYSGSALYGNANNSTMYVTKDGIAFLHNQAAPGSLTAARKRALGMGYSGDFYTVYIDTNGNNKGPNMLGKDLFTVIVDTKGSVIPMGGSAYSAYYGVNNVYWQGDACGNPKKAPTNATYCAGSIADNGYKVIY